MAVLVKKEEELGSRAEGLLIVDWPLWGHLLLPEMAELGRGPTWFDPSACDLPLRLAEQEP